VFRNCPVQQSPLAGLSRGFAGSDPRCCASLLKVLPVSALPPPPAPVCLHSGIRMRFLTFGKKLQKRSLRSRTKMPGATQGRNSHSIAIVLCFIPRAEARNSRSVPVRRITWIRILAPLPNSGVPKFGSKFRERKGEDAIRNLREERASPQRARPLSRHSHAISHIR